MLHNTLFSGDNSILEYSRTSFVRIKGSIIDNSDIPEISLALESIFKERIVYKIVNKVFGSSLSGSAAKTNISSVSNTNLKTHLRGIARAFSSSNLRDNYVFKKSSLNNKNKKNILNEEYVIGNLSNLLFEDRIIVEGVKNKSNELNESNINLRREWLKIWDI